MYKRSTIHITPVDNGWLVELPMFDDELPFSIDEVKREIFDDPELNRIRDNVNKKSLREKLQEYKSKHLHIFKTFPEALDFLDRSINGQ